MVLESPRRHPRFGVELVENGAFLRACGYLSTEQRRVLQTGGGLSSGALPAEARKWLQRALEVRQRIPTDPVAGLHPLLAPEPLITDATPFTLSMPSRVRSATTGDPRPRLVAWAVRSLDGSISHTFGFYLPRVEIDPPPAPKLP
jgi:hypothetical protein